MESTTKITYEIEREAYKGTGVYEAIEGCQDLKSLNEVEKLLEEMENELKWTGKFKVIEITEVNGIKKENDLDTVFIEGDEYDDEESLIEE